MDSHKGIGLTGMAIIGSFLVLFAIILFFVLSPGHAMMVTSYNYNAGVLTVDDLFINENLSAYQGSLVSSGIGSDQFGSFVLNNASNNMFLVRSVFVTSKRGYQPHSITFTGHSYYSTLVLPTTTYVDIDVFADLNESYLANRDYVSQELDNIKSSLNVLGNESSSQYRNLSLLSSSVSVIHSELDGVSDNLQTGLDGVYSELNVLNESIDGRFDNFSYITTASLSNVQGSCYSQKEFNDLKVFVEWVFGILLLVILVVVWDLRHDRKVWIILSRLWNKEASFEKRHSAGHIVPTNPIVVKDAQIPVQSVETPIKSIGEQLIESRSIPSVKPVRPAFAPVPIEKKEEPVVVIEKPKTPLETVVSEIKKQDLAPNILDKKPVTRHFHNKGNEVKSKPPAPSIVLNKELPPQVFKDED